MAHLSEEDLALLEGHFLFEGLSPFDLREAVSDEGCRVDRMEKGGDIYTPRDYVRALGILLSGRIRVSKEGFPVSTLEGGEVFGAAALYNDREEYAVTLTALAPCRVLFFSQGLMSTLMARHSALAERYIRYLSGRIRFLEGKLGAVLAPGAAGKLSRYLLARREGDVTVLDCPMSELAKRLDLGRTSLYRAFETLTAAGAIEKQGKLIHILKEDALL